MDATKPQPNNPIHVAFCVGIIVCASGLLVLGRLAGGEWVSVATWTTAILILGQPIGLAAAGFSVSASAKAAQVMQSIKEQSR